MAIDKSPRLDYNNIAVFSFSHHLLLFKVLFLVGVWLSLVERCVRDAEAEGSNPFTPTNFFVQIQTALPV